MLRDDLLPAGRKFIDHRDIEVAVNRHRERARDRRRGHDEHVRCDAFPRQFEALHHAESMLLVDDHEAEFGELDVLFNQRMRPDGDGNHARAQHIFQLLFLARGRRPGQQRYYISDLLE